VCVSVVHEFHLALFFSPSPPNLLIFRNHLLFLFTPLSHIHCLLFQHPQPTSNNEYPPSSQRQSYQYHTSFSCFLYFSSLHFRVPLLHPPLSPFPFLAGREKRIVELQNNDIRTQVRNSRSTKINEDRRRSTKERRHKKTFGVSKVLEKSDTSTTSLSSLTDRQRNSLTSTFQLETESLPVL